MYRELRTGAQGLARLPSGGPNEEEVSLQPDAGEAVWALRRELADLAGSVGDAAAHAEGTAHRDLLLDRVSPTLFPPKTAPQKRTKKEKLTRTLPMRLTSRLH